MPHTPSAAKRLRKAEKRRQQNKAAAKKIKVKRKAVAEALKAGDVAAAQTAYQGKQGEAGVQATLDRAADKGYIHRNKAARLKSRLVKKLRAAANKPAAAPAAK
jgi:small subunit ribosomal protein S20